VEEPQQMTHFLVLPIVLNEIIEMTLESYLVVVYVQAALSGIIALMCFYKFNARENVVKLIGLLFSLSFLSTMSTLNFGYGNITGSVYFLLSVIIAGWIYNQATGRKYATLLLATSIIFVGFAVINLLFIQKNANNSYSKMAGSFIIILYCVFYFYHLMQELPTVHVQRLPMFWFNSAFLLFYAGTVFLFAFTGYLIHVLKDDMLAYWAFHNVLFIMHQLIILVGVTYSFRSSVTKAVT
jgi:hypothetical protein